MTRHDVRDLVPELSARAEAALRRAKKELGKRGAEKPKNLRELLERQRKRIEAKAAEFDKAYDPKAPMLPGLMQEEPPSCAPTAGIGTSGSRGIAKEVESRARPSAATLRGEGASPGAGRPSSISGRSRR